MATHEEIRQICAKLPGAVEGEERFGFGVEVKGKVKGFCWSWAERVHPKKARVINDDVLAISVPNLTIKQFLMDSSPERFVEDPHYNGYPAVLARLDAFDAAEIEEMLVEAWKTKAPKDLLRQFAAD